MRTTWSPPTLTVLASGAEASFPDCKKITQIGEETPTEDCTIFEDAEVVGGS